VDDRAWLERAIELSHRCWPAEYAYSVGALVVAGDGTELAAGYSRETDAHVHAEEAALAKIAQAAEPVGPAEPAGPSEPAGPAGATLYTSMEPCSRRSSRLRTCAELIVAAGITRVVFAWREPDLFVVDARGRDLLAAAGVSVVELPELAGWASAANAHLPL
jgi:diaminohydroxyphosphoribosylaminopyrimidine deaminase/5-amino-6-(5-phosphoribosylamino)uracil reductase